MDGFPCPGPSISVSNPRSSSILDHFAALRDPREGWRVLYPLQEILLVVLCATLCGMDDFVEVKLWGEARLEFLRRFLPFERGIPSYDMLNDVMNGIDPGLFKSCFADWVATLRDGQPDIIAIDGRMSRCCHDIPVHHRRGRSRAHTPERSLAGVARSHADRLIVRRCVQKGIDRRTVGLSCAVR